MFPNDEPKTVGAYVRNVHPVNAGRIADGVVLQAEGGADEQGEQGTVHVQVGTGSTCYGPARNWRVIETCPYWLTHETKEVA